MTVKEYKKAFFSIAEVFPDCDMVVKTNDGMIIYSYKKLNLLDETFRQNAICEEWASKNGGTYYRLLMNLTSDVQIMMLFPKEQNTLPTEIISRLLTLKTELSSLFQSRSTDLISSKYYFFLDQVLNKYSASNDELYNFLAVELGIDVSLPRIVILIHFTMRNARQKADAPVHKLLAKLQREGLISTSDLVFPEESGDLIILKTADSKIPVKKQFSEFLHEIKTVSSDKLHLKTRIGVSVVVKALSHYGRALQVIRSLMSKMKDSEIIFASDHIPMLTLEYTPDKTLEHFMQPYSIIIANNPELLKTMGSLIHNNMNIHQAALNSHMHRNTMVQHIHRLQEKLNLDPIHSENDRLTMEFLYYYCSYYTDLFVR